MYNLTTTCLFGGVETFVWETSRELGRRGEEVHILGGRGERRENVPNARVLLFPFWGREKIPNFGRRFQKLVERMSMSLFALDTLRREKYDILHIHKPFDLPLGAWVRKRAGSRLILGSHGTDFFGGDRIFARAVDASVSCSRFNASLIARRYRLNPEVIYNGFDPERFRPLPGPDANLMKHLGISRSDAVILYAGRLIGLKGVQTLLRAARRIPKHVPVKVLIVGEGEGRGALESLSRELGLERQAVFAGFVPHGGIPPYFGLARFAVFPSLADEAFGISICEAMACGLPVIGTRVGGIPELIAEGQTGFLVEPRDEAGLAEKMGLLLEDPEGGRKMGQRAAERVRELFTWGKVVDRLVRVYHRVLSPAESVAIPSRPADPGGPFREPR
jgi:glycosyltransferase involved in cell wall biosynthesis